MYAERLTAVRAELRRLGVDGFVLPVADPHLGEYMPERDLRLAWLTGFTGSAGIAIVLEDAAHVMSDGRYVLQLAAQTDPALWTRGHMIETPPAAWLARHLAGRAARIGYDPWLMSEESLGKYTDAGLTMVALEPDPIDTVWTDQPPPPVAPALVHPLSAAGRASAEKREALAAALAAQGLDAAVISDPASVNWLLNIRGGDVPFTPFALGFALLRADAAVDVFMEPAKLSGPVREWLGNAVRVRPPAELRPAMGEFSGKRVLVDAAGTAAWFAQTLRSAGAAVVAGADPCALPKAIKTAAEQAGARAAHVRDGVALARFFYAIEGRTDLTELSGAALLAEMRAADPAYRGESFAAISGAGPDGAIIHYRVTEATDRPINRDEVYLIDSGGQYTDGTTDVTRTLWHGTGPAPAEVRAQYTRVLAGHLDLAALVFPEGIAGGFMDVLARRALWQAGLDYDHGTGHGVGSCLSVHEGPIGISRTAKPVPLAAGMILSNEPGYYRPGHYGMRVENLLLVVPAEIEGAIKRFLRFEDLTLAPYERRLIERGLLSPAQLAQVNAYHARVLAEIGPLLPPDVRGWLAEACTPL